MERKIQRIEKVSPPAGGELLCPWRQSNQNAPGVGSGWALACPYSPTPDPITGDAILIRECGISGAQNQECLGAIPSGPPGPE